MPDPNALFQSAVESHQSGRIGQAIGLYRSLLARFPRHAKLLYLLGTAECQHGRPSAGLGLLEESIRIDPNNSEAHNNRGIALAALDRPEDALRSFGRAIELDPGNVGARLGLADTYHSLARYEDAIRTYQQALQLAPANPSIHYFMGFNLHLLGRHVDAMRSYEQAIQLRPDFGEAHWNKSLLKLLTGDFAEGWKLYEWRWKAGRSRAYFRDFPHPLWLGQESIAGKTILIHAEGGLGDSIQFCRYLPMVQRMGAKIVLEIQSALVSLISTLKCNFTVVHGGQEIPDFDVQCPMMSLPLAFRTELETIPAEVPYLHGDPIRQRRWRENLGARKALRIGLAWSGNREHSNDRNRSISVDALRPLLQMPFEYHSLQREYQEIDEDFLRQHSQIRDHRGQLADFSDTAALMSELDLVISVDTSVAHLAGAIGKNVWILLPFVPDFRWLLDRTDSPWYPTATLYRQPKPNDWRSVIQNVMAGLTRLS